MIRSFEKTHSATCLSHRARLNSRIPIFAVSASLVESEKQKYIDTGFDGWILKPVDFKRVGLLLKGIVDDEARRECLYQPGKWEQGGWFEDRAAQPDIHDTDTKPSDKPPTSVPPPLNFPRADTV
jgi:DNA-binding response OmpR family regulator